jgi:hypothetical protein
MALNDGLRPDAGVSYLRPNQLAEMGKEEERLQRDLTNDGIAEKADVQRSLNRLQAQREKQKPPELTEPERDRVAKLELQLREDMQIGMPTHAEMENAPPGAVSKHQDWEDRVTGAVKMRNKSKHPLWQNLRILLDPSNDTPDLANFEQYRPGGAQLNMDNAYIERKSFHFQGVGNEWERLSNGIRYDVVFGREEERKGRATLALAALEFMLGKDRPAPNADQVAALEDYMEGRVEPQKVEPGTVTESELMERDALPSERQRSDAEDIASVTDLSDPTAPEAHVLKGL